MNYQHQYEQQPRSDEGPAVIASEAIPVRCRSVIPG